MQDFWFKHADNETYMVQAYRGDDSCVVVPSSYYGANVSVLMDDIFKGHQEIREVRLPDTLTDIGGFVFDGCTGLKKITLPKSLKTFWQYAFVRSAFEELVIPEGVYLIPPFCFKECVHLKKITFEAKNLKIMGQAFLDCKALAEVRVFAKTEIHPLAFKNCPDVRIIQKD
ncbi:MAG: leucine-rich repeat domain-containing protein [Solobacterium sp.]|nr:leucine-rich repeat domain-containing protein [Solobacterium sp.]